LQRVAAAQAAAHVSWYEADAWCRWAARRLPTELEWELAVIGGATRGFVWGDVREWVSGRPGRWSDQPASVTPPWTGDVPAALWPSYRVMRGASVLTVPRLKHPRARSFASPECDTTFVGFRSCSL
jgi:formylglycine-generating enzyme required for sulfatase activity